MLKSLEAQNHSGSLLVDVLDCSGRNMHYMKHLRPTSWCGLSPTTFGGGMVAMVDHLTLPLYPLFRFYFSRLQSPTNLGLDYGTNVDPLTVWLGPVGLSAFLGWTFE